MKITTDEQPLGDDPESQHRRGERQDEDEEARSDGSREVHPLIVQDGGGGAGESINGSGGGGGISSLQASASVAKAIMGAGSFALPWAFSQTGYAVGTLAMLGLMALSVASLRTLVSCRRMACGNGGGGGGRRRTASYVDVARAAFGDSGAGIVYGASLSASVGVCGSYLVFIAASVLSLLPNTDDGGSNTTSDGSNISQTVVLLAVLPLAVLLSSVRDASKFALASLLGDVSVFLGMAVVVVYGFLYVDPASWGDGCVAVAPLSTMPLAFGAVGFLFFIHFLILPIEGTMARPQEFDRMVTLTFLGCAVVSAAFGVAGYLFFGPATEQIVILNIQGSVFVSCVKVLLCVDLLFTYPVVMRPSIEIVERSLLALGRNKMVGGNRTGNRDRFIVCASLGCVAAGAGIFVPAFGLLSGLVGGVCQTFLAFVMPPLMLRRLQRQRKTAGKSTESVERAKVAGIVVFGLFMIAWTIHSTWVEIRRG